MKYLETFKIFEAIAGQDVTNEIVNALKNTEAGKDLLALAHEDPTVYYPDPKPPFIARKTGKVEINNLRGLTFITKKEDGRWYHATKATGRIYGDGSYDTLEECIRGLWTEFIENSSYMIPDGMTKKTYHEYLDKELSNLIGKKFTKNQIREYLVNIYNEGGSLLENTSPFFSTPRWIQIFEFLGLENQLDTEDRFSYSSSLRVGISKDPTSILSILAKQLIPNSGITVYELDSLYVTFYKYLKKINTSDGKYIRVGDYKENIKQVEDYIAKTFIKRNIKEIIKEEWNDGVKSWNGKQKITQEEENLRKMIMNFALGVFAMGLQGESKIDLSDETFFESIASEIKKSNPSAGILSSIRSKAPKLWDFYTKSTGDNATIDALSTLADLGDLGF